MVGQPVRRSAPSARLRWHGSTKPLTDCYRSNDALRLLTLLITALPLEGSTDDFEDEEIRALSSDLAQLPRSTPHGFRDDARARCVPAHPLAPSVVEAAVSRSRRTRYGHSRPMSLTAPHTTEGVTLGAGWRSPLHASIP
jgi:hypothetical protein